MDEGERHLVLLQHEAQSALKRMEGALASVPGIRYLQCDFGGKCAWDALADRVMEYKTAVSLWRFALEQEQKEIQLANETKGEHEK